MWALLKEDTARRRLLMGGGVYLLSTLLFLTFSARTTLTEHTPWNHFSLLAEAWLKGRLDLGGPPPAYTGNNDFANYQGRWFVVFPPFPAVLLLPIVALAGTVTRVRDGQFFLWLAGIAPSVLFLALEKLRRTGQSRTTLATSFALACLFALGTVYFFTAVQGTVWYAAHVVGATLAASYLLFALDAAHPLLAGTALGLGLLTRAPLVFMAPLWLLEAMRVHARSRRSLLKSLGLFGLPIAVSLAFLGWYNQARFGSPWESGYRYLTVAWQARMQQWGLFHYHYLGRNLGVFLTSLPYPAGPNSPAALQINGHGLALWFTSPFFLWLLWPRRTAPPHRALWWTVAAVAVPTLFYQNTGWLQFGYRFSNDYAVFLFALLAIGGYRLGRPFWLLGACAILINAFGALTFGRPACSRYYYVDPTQRILYQPD
jgi:hypothetical protein